MKNAKGFTLIELVVVIVILGILAATALPKFVDLKSDAANAAAEGVAAAISSAATLNYSKYQVNSAAAENLSGTNSCAQLAGSSKAGIGLTGGLSAAHATISADADCTGPGAGETATCEVQSTDDTTQTALATIICTN